MTSDDDLVDPRPAGDESWPGVDRARVSGPASPGSARVIRARAVLDAAAAADLRRETRALLARSGDPIVVDLTAVRDVEPVASGALRDLAYEAGDADVDLRVVRGPGAPAVSRALLDDGALFELYPTLDAALPCRSDRTGSPNGR
jgi:anti-anti-sigma regulatory factor